MLAELTHDYSYFHFSLPHSEAGIVSMVSYGKNTNNTEFRISDCALPPLNGVSVAVGIVILGMDYLHEVFEFY